VASSQDKIAARCRSHKKRNQLPYKIDFKSHRQGAKNDWHLFSLPISGQSGSHKLSDTKKKGGAMKGTIVRQISLSAAILAVAALLFSLPISQAQDTGSEYAKGIPQPEKRGMAESESTTCPTWG
jgi:hypothetical protein